MNVRVVKGVLYPFAAVLQLIVASSRWLGIMLAVALLGLAIVNWIRLWEK